MKKIHWLLSVLAILIFVWVVQVINGHRTVPTASDVVTTDTAVQSQAETNDSEFLAAHNLNHLYLQYKQPVNDYSVKVLWLPQELSYDKVFGPAILLFKHNSGVTFTIACDYFYSDVMGQYQFHSCIYCAFNQ